MDCGVNDKDIINFLDSIWNLEGEEFVERAVCFAGTFFPQGYYSEDEMMAMLYLLCRRDEFSKK